MAQLTRRELLGASIGAATAGAAIAGGASLLPGRLASGAALAAATRGGAGATAGEPLVAFVRPGSNSRLEIMVGDRQVVLDDAQLVSRLVSATVR